MSIYTQKIFDQTIKILLYYIMFSKQKIAGVASGAAQQMSDMPGAQRVIGVGQQGLVDPGAKVPWKLVGIVTFLTVLFVSTSSMGIGIYNNCQKAKNSKKWTNIIETLQRRKVP